MESFDLQPYVRPLLRWWWLLLLSTVIAGGFSAYTVSQQPLLFRSYATVMVGTVLADPNPNTTQINLANQLASAYADIAKRSTIYDATKAALGLPSLPPYSARQVPNTQIIEIAVTDTDPRRAQAVAAELVNQLVLQTPGGGEQDDRQTFVEQQLDVMEKSIDDTRAEIERLQRELEGLFSARRIADTNAEINALELKLSSMQSNYAALLANSQRNASNTLNVLETASLPNAPVDNNAPLMVLAGAMLGFALAAAGAYLLEYLDDTFRFEDDVRKRLNLSILGMIPDLGRFRQRGGALDLESAGISPASHAFGGLRIAIKAASADRPVRLLLISSPVANEGKSFVAANLAIEMAQAGQRVILVDADLRRPSQQRLFRLPNHQGVTSLFLQDEMDVDSVLQSTPIAGLSVLTSGPLPAIPQQVLGSSQMQALLSRLRQRADTVILDTPPVSAAVDASILSTQADGVLLVIALGRTGRKMAVRAAKLLRQLNANLLGVVLDNAPLTASHYSRAKEYELRGMRTHVYSASHEVPELSLNGTEPAQAAYRLKPLPPHDRGISA